MSSRTQSEIALDRAADAHRRKTTTGKQISGVIDIEAEHARSDGLGHDHQIGVLQPQELVFNIATIDQAKKLLP